MSNLEDTNYAEEGVKFTTFCDAFKPNEIALLNNRFFGVPMSGKWMRREGDKLVWFASAFMLFRWRKREELSWRSHVIKESGRVIYLPVWRGSDLLWTTDMNM